MTFEIARTALNETGSLESLTTKQLVDAYNALAEKPVKKFQDRATALRRTEALVREKVVEDAAVEQIAPAFAQIDEDLVRRARLNAGECPACGGDAASQTAAGAENTTLGQNFNFCHECGTTYSISDGAERKPVSAKRSLAIMESWNDLAVHTKRRQRSAVRVKNAEGEVAEFRSVKHAFLALGLPLSKHIRFRMDLKAAGKLEAFGMEWTNIPLNY